MTVDRTLIVFVRAPAISAVKRRLAAGIGPLAAHRGHYAARHLAAPLAIGGFPPSSHFTAQSCQKVMWAISSKIV